MRRTLFDTYMTKVAQGDESFRERLCYQLLERLVYLPVLSQRSSGGSEKVKTPVVQHEGRTYVIVFTSEQKLQQWADSLGEEVSSLDLLGGDLSLALDPQHGLALDVASELSVYLPAHVVSKIAYEATSETKAELAPEVAPQVAPARNAEPAFSELEQQHAIERSFEKQLEQTKREHPGISSSGARPAVAVDDDVTDTQEVTSAFAPSLAKDIAAQYEREAQEAKANSQVGGDDGAKRSFLGMFKPKQK